MADTAFGQRYEPELRLLDVHAPELTQPGGAECTAFVNAWFGHVATIDPGRRWNLYVETVQTKQVEPTQKMSFTRYVATVWPVGNRAPEASLNWLLAQYLAGHPEWPSGM
jgi:hypothetical protein